MYDIMTDALHQNTEIILHIQSFNENSVHSGEKVNKLTA